MSCEFAFFAIFITLENIWKNITYEIYSIDGKKYLFMNPVKQFKLNLHKYHSYNAHKVMLFITPLL